MLIFLYSTDMEKNADIDLKNSEVFGPKAASNLARPLTAAEVRLAQAAEERAKRALQGLEQIPVRSTTPSSSKVESKKAPQIPTYEKPAPPPKLSYLEQRSAALTRLNPKSGSPIPQIAATTTTTQKPQAPFNEKRLLTLFTPNGFNQLSNLTSLRFLRAGSTCNGCIPSVAEILLLLNEKHSGAKYNVKTNMKDGQEYYGLELIQMDNQVREDISKLSLI